jgi:putative Ca2+/H+ antiporter (TMEM165/GDT1 family)
VEGPLAAAAALGLVALLELGDKTQIATIALASKHPWPPVFAGAAAGLITATVIGVAAGLALATAMGGWIVAIRLLGGGALIAFGLWGYYHQEEDEVADTKGRSVLAQAFLINLGAEMGDKTQIAVLLLAASESAPFSVFLGASAGLVMIAGLSVLLGRELARRLTASRVRLISTVLLVGAGAFLVAEAVLGG